MADIHGSPDAGMFGGSVSGPGPEFPPGPANSGAPAYGVPPLVFGTPGGEVMGLASGGIIQEAAYAHDLAAGAVAPYYPGAVSPVLVGGDADAGGRDDVAGSVAASVASAEARYMEHESDTHTGTLGDVIDLPAPASGQPGVGSFFDPPRDY